MQISENKVYVFTFNTDHGDLAIPVRGENRNDAGDKLQKMLSRFQTELAMEFPKVAPKDVQGDKIAKEIFDNGFKSVIPPEVLELRLNTLLADLGGGELKGKGKAQTIKNWTGYELTEENYTHIITELELIKTGQKEIPKK